MSLFFNNPDSRYYLREIARHIVKDAAGIKRELDTLVKIGLLAQEKRGVQKYYYANKRSPVFSEMKGLIFKTTGVQGSIKAAFSRLKGAQAAFIMVPTRKGTRSRTATSISWSWAK